MKHIRTSKNPATRYMVWLAGAAIAGLAMATPPVLAQMAQTVSSSIQGSNCVRKYQSFTVPAGRTAANFRVLGISAGRTCKTNQVIRNTGFSIRNRNYATVYRSGSGNLAALRLGAGSYSVAVDGGNGARVTLSYVIR